MEVDAAGAAAGEEDDDDLGDVELEMNDDKEAQEKARLEALLQKKKAIMAKFNQSGANTPRSETSATQAVGSPQSGMASHHLPSDDEDDEFQPDDLGFDPEASAADARGTGAGTGVGGVALMDDEDQVALRDAENEKLQHMGAAPLKARHGLAGPPVASSLATAALSAATQQKTDSSKAEDDEEPDMFSDKFRATTQAAAARSIEGNADLSDNWDDADGYYRELLVG